LKLLTPHLDDLQQSENHTSKQEDSREKGKHLEARKLKKHSVISGAQILKVMLLKIVFASISVTISMLEHSG